MHKQMRTLSGLYVIISNRFELFQAETHHIDSGNMNIELAHTNTPTRIRSFQPNHNNPIEIVAQWATRQLQKTHTK